MTEMGGHLHSGPGCRVAFDGCGVLTYGGDQCRRGLKEGLCMQRFGGGTLINDGLASVPLFLFGLPTCQDRLGGRIFPGFW